MHQLHHTPTELYHSHGISVKREDLCTIPPAPPFSKMRGVVAALAKLRDSGVSHVAYVETSISMAGWGVAWAGKQLGLRVTLFDPQYVGESHPLLLYHRERWAELGAHTVGLPAGRAKVNWYMAKKLLAQTDSTAVLLPLGVPFEETIQATADEAQWTFNSVDVKTIVCCVGSGTICAGLVKWAQMSGVSVIGVMSRTGSVEEKTKTILAKAKVVSGGFFAKSRLTVVDPGWQYVEAAPTPAPFPCHPYYDLKAWNWLLQNPQQNGPVVFWNIGSSPISETSSRL